MQLLDKAISWAIVGHQGQFRKYGHNQDPYIIHPMRVAGLLQIALGDRATEIMMVAVWLHDILEDTHLTEEQLLDVGIPQASLRIVRCLTKDKTDNRPRKERAKALADFIGHNCWWEVRVIKLADRCDNLGDMTGDVAVPVEFAKMYAQESLLLVAACEGTNEFLENRIKQLCGIILAR
jgi:(p)ppGpp synthase/HD superfamily hydrolase